MSSNLTSPLCQSVRPPPCPVKRVNQVVSLAFARFNVLFDASYSNLVRNLFQCQSFGARPEDADGQHDHQHARRDECENTFGAEVLKEKRNHEAREYCREAAPGINKSDRASADASGKKFGLIGMQRKKQQIIGERNEHS